MTRDGIDRMLRDHEEAIRRSIEEAPPISEEAVRLLRAVGFPAPSMRKAS